MTVRVNWQRRGSSSYPAQAPTKSTARLFRGLVLATMIAAFGLVTLGAVVRATDSGLGCPDWPLCFQGALLLDNQHAYIEVSHRLAAGAVGLLMLGVAAFAWRSYRMYPWVYVPAALGFLLLVVQALLGGVTVLTELPRWAVMAHLALAEAMIAVLVMVYVAARRTAVTVPTTGVGDALGRFPTLALGTALATYALLITGSYVANTLGATYVCGDSWPLCRGELLPSDELSIYHMGHRLLSLVVGILVATTMVMAWRRRQSYPHLWATAGVVGLLFLAQVFVGAADQWLHFPAGVRVLHLSLATGVWVGLALLAFFAISESGSMIRRGARGMAPASLDPSAPGAGQRSLASTIADYITLTKPPIVVMLLITALGGMFLAAQGLPQVSLMLWLMAGGAMAAGGANTINHALERDVDGLMIRTRHRPVPANRVSGRAAMTQGVVLNVAAFLMLATQVNVLTALLTLSATLFYILVYTRWLKRTTPQNIVIGGAAGSVPPLAGWAAVTGGLDLPAIYLFAIVFFWTPPHFWALSLLIKDDYARAGLPMLPLVRGVRQTVRSIMLYSMVLVAITLMFFIVPEVGWLYLLVAAGLGSMFLALAWRLLRSDGVRGAKPLYLYSLLYLALIFTVVIVDSAVAF